MAITRSEKSSSNISCRARKSLSTFRRSPKGSKGAETITLSVGDESVEFAPPEYLGFEVEYEKEGDKREVEFEFKWTVQEDELNIDSE